MNLDVDESCNYRRIRPKADEIIGVLYVLLNWA